MKTHKTTSLARALLDFFADHLPRLRGMSPHTIHSYRDSIKLLLRFVAGQQHRPVAKLDLDDITAARVIDFLQHLEDERHNAATTRNVRLAAIHAFFRYLAGRHPDRLEHCQRILGVPFKRARSKAVEYLEYEEIQAVLAAVDRAKVDGRRDYALLATMFNTGARVQEIIDLRPRDLQLVSVLCGPKPCSCCRRWLTEYGLDPLSHEAVFRNHRGHSLTRFGVRYILAKYCERAHASTPTLAGKRLHPHSMRHSTAIHLLKSGVDLSTISHWLGHASMNTTSRYATVDLEMKRDAISKAAPIGCVAPIAAWRTDASILTWLESL